MVDRWPTHLLPCCVPNLHGIYFVADDNIPIQKLNTCVTLREREEEDDDDDDDDGDDDDDDGDKDEKRHHSKKNISNKVIVRINNPYNQLCSANYRPSSPSDKIILQLCL